MKKYLFLILTIIAFNIQAQQNFEGCIRYLVTHHWTKRMATLDYLSQQKKDKMDYMWGNRSEWKQYMNLYFNPTESKYEESEEKAEREDETYNWKKEMFFIKRNFDKMTMQEGFVILGRNYILEDSLKVYDWKIQNDLKEVAGHVCMKAFIEDTIKKQKIVAWFAQDIPLSAGPERYYGLPGLILELDYNDGAMLIAADKIDLKKLNKELDPPQKMKGKKIKEAEYYDILKKHIAEKTKAEEPWFWGLRY